VLKSSNNARGGGNLPSSPRLQSTALNVAEMTGSKSALTFGGQGAASVISSAFQALDEKDQYDAVLTGLCAKILDGTMVPNEEESVAERIARQATMTPTQLAYDTLKDPIRLLEEMNNRRVRASERSLMALIDATATTQDPRAMATVLSLSTRNGSISSYGSEQSAITPFPPTSNARVKLARQGGIPGISNKKMTRSERLEKLSSVPSDNRGAEVSSALLTMATVGSCLTIQGLDNVFGNGYSTLDTVAPYTNLLLSGIITVGVLDNFFDAIKATGSFIVKANSDKLPDAVKNMNGPPDKENMPLELGSGKITGTVVRGLTRLWSTDTERECECEAASFFAAYTLGLPCFSFQPNALEAAVMAFESHRDWTKDVDDDDDLNVWGPTGKLDSLLSNTGVLKILIWLMAPVAMESSLHPQLIASEPKEARGVLTRLREKASYFEVEDLLNEILQYYEDEAESEQEIDDLLKWAYNEADLLLRENKAVVREVTERLIGGASTVGDCVGAIEDW
jgi:hypothetical protein